MTAQMSIPQMEQIAARYERISDKTRALSDAGCSISQIAKVLDRSYQQIRQVVKEYEARKARSGATMPAVEPAPRLERKAPLEQSGPTALFRLTADEDGSVRLPRHVAEAFGVSPGDVVVGVAGDGELVLRSGGASIKRAQELVRALIPGEDSLADSLIADRRREVEDERLSG
jgi:antitoxin component of MazEF toxin-antitoxin module